MKYNIFSWNVNGIRAVLNKGALQQFIADKSPDFLCLQETKAKQEQKAVDFPEYQEIWNSAVRPGYSGTAIFVKNSQEVLNTEKSFSESLIETPENIENLKQSPWQDAYGSPLTEGRILAVELEPFYLVTVYTPNSKRDLSRLKLRETLWDPVFLKYLKLLEQKKPVVVCGDFNAAHTEIDLARPQDNQHSAGFTPEERRGIDNLLEAGFLDTFRLLHPDERRYTWWSHWAKARERNIGWRIDYFLISRALEKNLTSAEIYENITGSDHCPVSITLEF